MSAIKIDDILQAALNIGASDIHIGAGRRPYFRVEGRLLSINEAPELSDEDVRALLKAMMNEKQWKKFEDSHEMDLAYSIPGVSRFRVNAFLQRGTTSIAIRAIPYEIRDFRDTQSSRSARENR